jgi:hypothetical protein
LLGAVLEADGHHRRDEVHQEEGAADHQHQVVSGGKGER